MFRARGALCQSRYVRTTGAFETAHPLPAVWALFEDPAAVIGCLPGATLIEDRGAGACAGRVRVRMGPLAALFEGEADFRSDPETNSATIVGKGVETPGGTRGRLGSFWTLHPTGAGTRVEVRAEVTLLGAAAHFGDGPLIRGLWDGVMDGFARRLEARLDAARAGESARAGRAGPAFRPRLRGVAALVADLLGRPGVRHSERRGPVPAGAQRFQEGSESGSIR